MFRLRWLERLITLEVPSFGGKLVTRSRMDSGFTELFVHNFSINILEIQLYFVLSEISWIHDI